MPPKIENRAVVEERARGEIEEESSERKKWRALDWYATPPWASRAGAEIVKGLDPDVKAVWEPACGDGIMARCLDDVFGFPCLATDIEPQNSFGQQYDFLNDPPRNFTPDWIITNPPYVHAQAFVEKGLYRARHGVALLCRLAFLETTGRAGLHQIFLTDLFPFSERVAMRLGPWQPDADTLTAYAWFIFRKTRRAGEGGFFRGKLIPPGTQARLSRADDVRRFCAPLPMPLFEGI